MSNLDIRKFLLLPRPLCDMPGRLRHLAGVLSDLADWKSGQGAAKQAAIAAALDCGERNVRDMLTELQASSGLPGWVLYRSWPRYASETVRLANGYEIAAPEVEWLGRPVGEQNRPAGEHEFEGMPSEFGAADEPVSTVSAQDFDVTVAPRNRRSRGVAVQARGGGTVDPPHRKHTADISSLEPSSPTWVDGATRPIGPTSGGLLKEKNSVAGQVTPSGQLARSGGALGPSRKRGKQRASLMLCSGFVPGASQLEAVRALGLEPEAVLKAFRGRHALEAQELPEAEWKRLFGGWARGAARIAAAPKREPKEKPKAVTEHERLEIIEALCKKEGISAYGIRKASQNRKVHAACAKLLKIPREDLAWTPGQIEALEETLERLRQ